MTVRTIILNDTKPTTLKKQNLTSAILNAVDPSMTRLYVAAINTLMKPSTATIATAAFIRMLDDAALRTPVAAVHPGWTRSHRCFCGYAGDNIRATDNDHADNMYSRDDIRAPGNEHARYHIQRITQTHL